MINHLNPHCQRDTVVEETIKSKHLKKLKYIQGTNNSQLFHQGTRQYSGKLVMRIDHFRLNPDNQQREKYPVNCLPEENGITYFVPS